VEEFLQLLDGLNGILRDKRKEDWKMDGETVANVSMFLGIVYVPPRQEDKSELLAEVLSSAKIMSQEGRDLKDVALLVSASLNAIHPYLDANGRTSRMIYLLLTKGFNAETIKELQAVLSESGRDKINIDPGLIQTEIDDLIKNEVGIDNPEINPDRIINLFSGLAKKEMEFEQEISEKDKNLFLELSSKDGQYLFWSVFEFLRNNPELNKKKFIKKFPNGSVILTDILVGDLNQEQLSQILRNYRNLKKKYVEKLVGSIANPDADEYQVDEDGQKIPLKTYFENRIKDEQDKRVEEERLEKEKLEAGR